MKKYILGLILVFLVACTTVPRQPVNIVPTNNIELDGTDELKKFNSKVELMQFLEQVQPQQQNNYFRSFGAEIMEDSMDMAIAPMAASESAGKSTASDFSTTNIQVKGVDEADFIKNDDKYIYIIANNQLVIVEAYPANDAKILSETKIDGRATDLFINKDKLVVFTLDNQEINTFAQYDILPRQIYKTITKALVYDISDKKNPKLQSDYDVKGNYITSRMIGDHVYVIVQDHVNYYNRYIDMPVVRESSRIAVNPSIYYFDNPESNYNFNTVMSFDLFEKNSVKAKTFMMGYANTIFVSKESIYITYQKNQHPGRLQENNENKFYEVILPILPKNVQEEIMSIQESNIQDKWDKITVIIEDMYNNMQNDDKDQLIEKIIESETEYQIKQEIERRKTVIHKINIKNGDLDYDTRGEIPGYLLNQFSMDEYKGNLRVATTFNAWVKGASILYNNVYILDENLDVIGEIEDIAPDERIYSTRFLGDRLYMVTFKQVDPFFVIDLSNPKDPAILGELKIPGFSDYLHPYDENHIIGIGKETTENQWGGVTTQGVKLALFDVSDVQNPKQVDKYEIGAKGSDSEALREHKAFLFDREKNLLVLPIREVKGRIKDPRFSYYRYDTWQGAYVFTLDEQGFQVRGKVSHGAEQEDNIYYRYGNNKAVRRSLFMDDVLYTVSMSKIMMNDIDDVDKINEVSLPGEYEENTYPKPWVRTAIE